MDVMELTTVVILCPVDEGSRFTRNVDISAVTFFTVLYSFFVYVVSQRKDLSFRSPTRANNQLSLYANILRCRHTIRTNRFAICKHSKKIGIMQMHGARVCQ